ncbi:MULTISPECIES: CPBP family intramembrane glutamic endopeptidase [Halorussus]|uniref:CPBP family intramembrane glutamic endopeptidase n=1 Tax=Halorussus TaxID=1070314 RepID=UPI0020A0060C|nr:CPBP family intramembrane glutamic endopeptidase [Halorussus vallis]USZ74855.1 CPBP family intramembrane metalloprotease [Halorussus vallis]
MHQTDDTATTAETAGDASFVKRFAALFALGMLGVLAVGISTATGEGGVPGLPEVSGPALAALVMIQPAILLAISVGVGLALAPRVGLRSHVDERVRGGPPVLGALRPEVTTAAAVGAAAYLAVVALDVAFAPLVAEDLAAVTPTPQTTTLAGLLSSLSVRLLYGGITEELLLRWGLLTLFAWVVHSVRSRVAGERRATLASSTAWVAIVASAVLFGVGHLPALATVVEPTPALVVRTVGLNAVAGVGFGWLYWRRSLEAAMVAHMAFHVALVGVSAVALAVA